MTASQPVSGTTSGSVLRSPVRVLAAVAALLACLAAFAPAARADDAAAGALVAVTALPAAPATTTAATPAPAAAPAARADCPTASGLLYSRASVRRSQLRLLCLMNRVRARFGLPPLHENGCLHRVAARHAHDMVHRRYFAHTTPNGWDPGRRARASGYVPHAARWIVGENIAWGVAGAARPAWVMRAWMHSAPHRRNILSRGFRDVGIGVSRGVPVGGFGHVPLRATFSVEFGAHGGRTRCG